MNCLSVEHLTISLQRTAQSSGKQIGGKEHLVSDVSFSIEERSMLAVIGASGSGKTLTALAVMGLLDRSVFSVHGSCVFSVHGSCVFSARACPDCDADADMPVDLFTLSERERKRYCMDHISMLYQNPFRSLSPVEKIKTHISHIAKIKRQQPDPERLDMLFEAVQLKKHEALNKYPHEFSGGELQRLAVARALAGNPQVLILDEPTSALDVITQKQLLDDMLPLLKGKTVLLISHDTRVIGYCADEILMLQEQQRLALRL